MGISTFIGFVISFGFVISAIVIGSDLRNFVNIPSLLLVLGGTIGATIVNFSFRDLVSLAKVLWEVMFTPSFSVEGILDELTALGVVARRDGFLGLERELPGIDDPFLKKGIELLVSNVDPDALVSVLNNEKESSLERYTTASSVLTAMGTYSPAFGLIGTLIGLIQMLRTISNPRSIGPAMALALITTLYGAVLSNAVFLPLAGKIERLTSMHMLRQSIIIEGLFSISKGENPRVMRSRLESFVSSELKKAA